MIGNKDKPLAQSFWHRKNKAQSFAIEDKFHDAIAALVKRLAAPRETISISSSAEFHGSTTATCL